MSRKILFTLIGLLALGALVVGGLAVAGVFNSAPLQGDTRHDFGIVKLTQDGKGKAFHTFTLTNVTAEPVHIIASKVSCGCTTTNDLADTLVQPGESIDVDAVLALNSSLEKQVRLTLMLGKHGQLMLHLAGKGRRVDPLFVRRSPIELMGGNASLNVYYETETNTPPATAVVSAPAGFTATVGAWRAERRTDPAHGRPAVWAAPLTVERSGETTDEEPSVTIAAGSDQVIVPIQ